MGTLDYLGYVLKRLDRLSRAPPATFPPLDHIGVQYRVLIDLDLAHDVTALALDPPTGEKKPPLWPPRASRDCAYAVGRAGE
jgi:hypothetical protein